MTATTTNGAAPRHDSRPAPRLLIITPVRDEAANIEIVARAMAAQTRPPDAWVVVDDGSTDETPSKLRMIAASLDFMSVLDHPSPAGAQAGDQLASGSCMRAFSWALSRARGEQFDYVGKLDGDVELPTDYFELLLERFEHDPQLGIACGDLIEPTGSAWKRVPIPPHHVHGALKLYRRECLEAIAPLPTRLGWDTMDETYARMHGFRTRSFPDVVARHHRPLGGRDGLLRGRARHGECAYINHFGPTWIALRSLKLATRRPIVLSGMAFLYGYARSAVRRTRRVDDREYRAFVRRELRSRMLGAVPFARNGGGVTLPELDLSQPRGR